MKRLMILSAFLLVGCAQSGIYTPEQQTRVMSDAYLCENKDDSKFSELRRVEIERRALNCKDVLENKEKALQEQDRNERLAREKQFEDADRMARKKPKISSINDQVLADSIDQYNIVRDNGGSQTDQCVYAGMVKAAAAQAKNAEFYSYWNNVAKLHCTITKWTD